MAQAMISVDVRSPVAEEFRRRGESPRRMVKRLAFDKASSLASQALKAYPQSLIIGADTIVVAPDRRTVLGKPRTPAEAIRMLGQLVGKTHQVLTGYCILTVERGRATRALSRVVASQVKMRKVPRVVIDQYVASGEPMDKAGGYGAQGSGMVLIERIGGSYTNVVGLPMAQLLADLEAEFGILPFRAKPSGHR